MVSVWNGSTYSEGTSGDLRSSTQEPVWAFGYDTTITGTVSPSDPTNSGFSDSIALDSTINQSSPTVSHPRALVAGQQYKVILTVGAFSRLDYKIERETTPFFTRSLTNDSNGEVIEHVFTADSSSDFYNVAISGWGPNNSALSYTVQIVPFTTTPANRNPVANTDTITVGAGKSVVINVTNNDTDPDGDSISFTGTKSLPTKGQATFNGGNPNITYTANANASGNDSFILACPGFHGHRV